MSSIEEPPRDCDIKSGPQLGAVPSIFAEVSAGVQAGLQFDIFALA